MLPIFRPAGKNWQHKDDSYRCEKGLQSTTDRRDWQHKDDSYRCEKGLQSTTDRREKIGT
jgi:hypothetical protein